MPERIHGRRAEVLLMIAAAGVIFLTGFVVYALLTDDPDSRRIERKVDKSLRLLNENVEISRMTNSSATCVAYQNHRAIEQSLIDIARLNNIMFSPPRVLPSKDTLDACRSVNIEIDDRGVPELSPQPGGTPEADPEDQ